MKLSLRAFVKNPVPILKFMFWNNEKLWNIFRINGKQFIYGDIDNVITNYDELGSKKNIYHPGQDRNSKIPVLIKPFAWVFWMVLGEAENPNLVDRFFQIISSVAFHFYLLFTLGITAYVRTRKLILLMPILLAGAHLAFLIPLINADYYLYYLCVPFMSFIWSPVYLYVIMAGRFKSLTPLRL